MEQSLQERGGRHRRWSLVGAVVAVIASLLVIVAEPNVGATPIAPVPNTEISLAVAADGTASFSDPAFAAGDVGDHTPGYDAGANNGIVRTFDTVTYRVDWNANERAADDVELSMTLPAGVRWKRDTTGMVAPGCLDDAAGSSISADGRTWTCALGSKAQGTAGAIFPVAEVEQLGDGQLVAVHASLSTLQAGVVQSNDVTSIVSAAPSANWVKGNQSGKAASNGMKPYDPALAGPSTPPGPTQIDDVMRSGVPGRIFIYPIWLEPGDIGRKGSEPLDDTYTYTIYDNAWALATGAILAPQSMMNAYAGGRTACGGYDGTGPLPLGTQTSQSTAENTTPGALAGGTVTCTDTSTTDGVVRLDIAGQDTSHTATKNADGTRNTLNASITAQIAWWVPESALRSRAGVANDGGSYNAGVTLKNDISGSASVSTQPSGPSTGAGPTITPITLRSASGGLFDESTTADNRAENSTLFAYTIPCCESVWSYTRFDPGAYREARYVGSSDYDWTVGDFRSPVNGGLGQGLSAGMDANGGDPTDMRSTSGKWDGKNEAPRNTVVTITTAAFGHSTPVGSVYRSEYLHSCTAIDTTHLQLVPLPSSFPVTEIHVPDVASERWGRPTAADTSTTSTGAPNAGPLATAIAGPAKYTFHDGRMAKPNATFGANNPSGFVDGVAQTTPFIVEFAHAGSGYHAAQGLTSGGDPSGVPTGTVGSNVGAGGVTCNDGDADASGWVAGTGDLSVFDADGDGRYEGIDLVRVRTLEPIAWNEVGGVVVHLQAQVGASPVAHPNGSEIYIHSSRAFGPWVGGQPQMDGSCMNTMDSSLTLPAVGDDLSHGWCNLPYDAANEGTGLDPDAVELSSSVGWDVHSDKLTIIDALPKVTKVNNDGLSDYVRNGDTATFTLTPSVVGATIDTVTAMSLVDTLPSTMGFVSATPVPTSVAGQVLTWDLGDHPGGWTGSPIEVTVRIVGAGPNQALKNAATVSGYPTGALAPSTAVASAFAYTPAAYRESSIVKAVGAMDGPCTRFPEAPGGANFPTSVADAWAQNCSRTSLNGDLSFTLGVTNSGGEQLTNYRVVDVFPFAGDGVEPQDGFSGSPNTGGPADDGDGRTPASSFVGTVGFGSITGLAADETALYSANAPGSIPRDPDEAVNGGTTWCTDVSGGTATFGSGACPTGPDSVTAVMITRTALTPGQSRSWMLNLTTSDNACDDVYTNSFGARAVGTAQAAPTPTATDMALEMRSNDVSAMVACTVDLALTKKLGAGQPGPFLPGDHVSFDVTVENQGTYPAEPVTVSDYVPAGLRYVASDNADAWGSSDVSGPATVSRVIAGPIVPGASSTVPIVLRLTSSAAGTLVNRSEISAFDTDGDPANGSSAGDPLDVPGDAVANPLADIDSTPDVDVANDAGGAVGTAADDSVAGNGTGTPGDGTAASDEDDADPAAIDTTAPPVFDLALTKKRAPGQPERVSVPPAHPVVPFEITVVNQGPTDAYRVQVTDTPAAGMSFVSVAGATGIAPTFEIPLVRSGDSVTFTVNYRLDDTSRASFVNRAEISAFDNDADSANAIPVWVVDVDSTPDTDPANDAGGSLGDASDDAVDGDGSGTPGGSDAADDEDDADPAAVTLDYDLAVRKRIDPTDSAGADGLVPGERVRFLIEVFNQGRDVDSVSVVDGVAASSGFQFDPVDNPAGTGSAGSYAASAPQPTYVWDATDPEKPALVLSGGIEAGTSVVVPVVLTVATPMLSGAALNTVEISAFGDSTNPDPSSVVDRDSTPDSDLTNDVMVDDVIDSNATTPPSGLEADEDDHDIARVPWWDLSLVKTAGTFKLNAGATPLEATFTVTVTNQGPTAAQNVHVVDTAPAGSVISGTSNVPAGTSCTIAGGGTEVECTIDRIEPGATLSLDVTIEIVDRSLGIYENSAEIASMQGTIDRGSGPELLDVTDIDSVADRATGNDVVYEADDDPFGYPRNSSNDPNFHDGVATVNEPNPLDEDDHDTQAVVLPVAVGDYVWDDANRDGVQDAGESPIAGVVVHLYDKDGDLVASTATDLNGFYVFDDLDAGTYSIGFELPAGGRSWTIADSGSGVDSTDSDALFSDESQAEARTAPFELRPGAPNMAVVTPGDAGELGVAALAAATINRTIDAGIVTSVSIGDFVWFDTDRDGVQDSGESPVEGVVVNLIDPDDGSVVATTTTDADGFYSFTGLIPSTEYTVEFVAPSGVSFTGVDAGGDDGADSDADPVSGRVSVTTPANGANSVSTPDDPTIDAGLVELDLSITKRLTSTGVVSPGSTVTFELVPHNNGPVDALAGWSVTDVLPAGLTLVSMTGDATYTCTGAACVSGVTLPTGADGGAVTVTATVDAGFTGTAHNVAYVSPAGSEIVESNPLVVPTTGTDTSSTSTNNDAQADVSSVLVSIGDFVWFDTDRDGVQDSGEDPVEGVVVNLIDPDDGSVVATTTTDADGFYSFTDLVPSTDYTVEFVAPSGVSFTGVDAGGDDGSDSDADPVSGRVSVTTPANGLNSATTPDDPTIDAGLVELDLSITKALTSTGVVSPGSTVTFELVPHNNGPVDALAGWSVTDVLPAGLTLVSMTGDATYTCTGAACVSSVVLASGADGGAVTVTATVDAGFTGTAHNVAYVSPAGSEIVESNPLVVPTTGTDTSSTSTNNDAQADVSSVLVSIGDFVWFDTDRDGVQDSGESPAEGVVVNLIDPGDGSVVATTTTDADGFYSFTGLIPSTEYTVEFVAPSGSSFTGVDAGGDDGADSDADPVSGRVSVTTPANGANSVSTPDDPTIDAGLIRFDLSVAKRLTSTGPVHAGDALTYELVPHNNGPVDALAGWSVTDVLPAGLTLVSLSGAGYDCDSATATCTAQALLEADADGAPIQLTAALDATATGRLRNVAYIAPSVLDIVEANPLDVPDASTDTSSSSTNNDDEAAIEIEEFPTTTTTAPAATTTTTEATAATGGSKDPGTLAFTGSDVAALGGLAIGCLLLGAALLTVRRRVRRRR